MAESIFILYCNHFPIHYKNSSKSGNAWHMLKEPHIHSHGSLYIVWFHLFLNQDFRGPSWDNRHLYAKLNNARDNSGFMKSRVVDHLIPSYSSNNKRNLAFWWVQKHQTEFSCPYSGWSCKLHLEHTLNLECCVSSLRLTVNTISCLRHSDFPLEGCWALVEGRGWEWCVLGCWRTANCLLSLWNAPKLF